MDEYRYVVFGCNLERRARLRRVDQQVAMRAIDKDAAQAEFANRALRLARRNFAVISGNRCKAMDLAIMVRGERGHLVIDGHDRIVRNMTLGVDDKGCGNVDDTRLDFTFPDVAK